jgi:hypothetical protein
MRRLRAVVTPESSRHARELALSANFDQALALAREKLQHDLPVAEVLSALFLPALRDIGELWQENSIVAADQALASRVYDFVIDQVWPDAPPTPRRGSVIIAAPEGERHTFAARLTGLGLSLEGWSVLDLGADVAVADVEAALATAEDVQGVIVHGASSSCLPAALTMIDAATRHGAGVVVAGGGFGEMGRYGAMLGAAGWAMQPGAAVSAQLPVAVSRSARPDELARRSSEAVVRRADAVFGSRPCPNHAEFPDDAAGPLMPVPFLAGQLAASVLIDEPHVMVEAVEWYRQFLASRGTPAAPLRATLGALGKAVIDIPGCRSPLAAAGAALE